MVSCSTGVLSSPAVEFCPFAPLGSPIELGGRLLVVEVHGGYVVAFGPHARVINSVAPGVRLRSSPGVGVWCVVRYHDGVGRALCKASGLNVVRINQGR